MPEIVNRSEAKERGGKRYFTGKECKNGHLSERFVSCMACVECSTLRHKKWKQDNPDRFLQHMRKHQAKRSDLIAVLRSEMPDLLKEFGL